MIRSPTKGKRVRRKPEFVAGNRVVGVTADGVKLLRGPGRPRQFTRKEIREAVAAVRAARASNDTGSQNAKAGLPVFGRKSKEVDVIPHMPERADIANSEAISSIATALEGIADKLRKGETPPPLAAALDGIADKLRRWEAAAPLAAALDGIADKLKRGEDVRVRGIGTVSVRAQVSDKPHIDGPSKSVELSASDRAAVKNRKAIK